MSDTAEIKAGLEAVAGAIQELRKMVGIVACTISLERDFRVQVGQGLYDLRDVLEQWLEEWLEEQGVHESDIPEAL